RELCRPWIGEKRSANVNGGIEQRVAKSGNLPVDFSRNHVGLISRAHQDEFVVRESDTGLEQFCKRRLEAMAIHTGFKIRVLASGHPEHLAIGVLVDAENDLADCGKEIPF